MEDTTDTAGVDTMITAGAAHGDGTDGTIGVTDLDMDLDMDTMAIDIIIDIITVITETTTTAVMATTAMLTTEAEEVIITPIHLPAIAQQEI